MAQVTSGTFKFTRRVKPGDPNEYNAPYREATAEISWSAAEDDTTEAVAETIANVSEAVVAKVNEMLGAKPAPKVEAAPVAQADPPGSDISTAEEDSQSASPDKPKRGRPPKSREPQIDNAPVPVIEDDDPLGLGDLTSPSVQPVTSEELLTAITRKNAERMARPEEEGPDRRNAQTIRDLIGKYVQLPQTARDIPIELRHKFLEELRAL